MVEWPEGASFAPGEWVEAEGIIVLQEFYHDWFLKNEPRPHDPRDAGRTERTLFFDLCLSGVGRSGAAALKAICGKPCMTAVSSTAPSSFRVSRTRFDTVFLDNPCVAAAFRRYSDPTEVWETGSVSGGSLCTRHANGSNAPRGRLGCAVFSTTQVFCSSRTQDTMVRIAEFPNHSWRVLEVKHG